METGENNCIESYSFSKQIGDIMKRTKILTIVSPNVPFSDAVDRMETHFSIILRD